MVARAHTFTIDGPQARAVTVELDVRAGLPAFTIVGLADAAVREARERIRTAVRNCGFEFPARRITANLAPGDLRKAGAGLDLAIACALLAASGQLPADRLGRVALLGELALDGRVRPVRGAVAAAHAARGQGLEALALSGACAREAALVEGLRVAAVESLESAARVLRGGRGDPLPPPGPEPPPAGPRVDLSEVRGSHGAVHALVVAAAGGHHLLLSGPPGTGKTMLARRLPTILPTLRVEEAIEVARIHGAGALIAPPAGEPPFRAPHHTITAAGLLGRVTGAPGEAVLAHRGVLFLDELAEFSRQALEALRQPLEDGAVGVARAGRTELQPARFMLVAATNPCPCGYLGEPRCACPGGAIARYRRRLGGPLMDRLDVMATVRPDRREGLAAPALTSSQTARDRVVCARERQAARLAGTGALLNSELSPRLLAEHARLDAKGERILARARRIGLLSGRGEHRALRVARTLADLEGRERIAPDDLAAALALRCEPGPAAP